jgi:hypothetical protein
MRQKQRIPSGKLRYPNMAFLLMTNNYYG